MVYKGDRVASLLAQPSSLALTFLVSSDAWVACQVRRDCACDDVVGAAHEDTHDQEHDEQEDRREVVGVHGEHEEAREEEAHEYSNDGGSLTTQHVAGTADDDATRHHPDAVEGCNKIRGDAVEVAVFGGLEREREKERERERERGKQCDYISVEND